MESITKRRLTPDDIREFVRAGLGSAAEVVTHAEFTEGFYAAVYGVALADGRQVVLKVAPDPTLRQLRYEVDLMRTEIEFYERAASAGVPLPRLWYADPDTGFMIMERLGGSLFSEAKKEMSAEEIRAVRRRIGELSARLNGVRGEFFGYPRRDGRTRSASWREAFQAIIADILADAEEFERDLTRPVSEVRALFERHGAALDVVTEPALVHFDLWDGNIFVRRDPDGWAIEGVIDGERALYADPILELVSLITFCGEDEADAVVDGYLGRPLTDDEQLRLCLYRVYLWLILVVEPAVRRYPPEEEQRVLDWVLPNLSRDLDRLAGT
ncbi:MAG: aminoglycoside phosphotransferase family protein [Hamadaea sp.]|uniref:phosphotransferase family protein n=1 Tax=Hamadaea sp. TaxID=2024425 RepID=UPI001818E608|nr:aminoglycoside phosphotransferase family protein [Hamadaea sp.]NUR72872.1 aminoglycoside phosphotransferase family protein [Hamadaea sp.]NUT21013.1 aminoglycoside phosphotransferase family protein [Hamadaea sp.]